MLKNQKHQHTLRKVLDSLEGVSNVEIEASSFNVLTQTLLTNGNGNANPTNKCVTTPKKKQTPVKLYMIRLVILVCTHVYLLNKLAMEFLIWVSLILMQSTIVKDTPQSYDSIEEAGMLIAQLVRVK
ncbi:hypothetical protein RDI58_028557 [Solanum bulbocastanum]|uniref:Uncharacterized protein n=1 Tax=Solanum bulbocastanum TaxID=147425 RepID=A0AAN8XZ29_SOLBU